MNKERELKLEEYYQELLEVKTITTLNEALVFKLAYEKALTMHAVGCSVWMVQDTHSLMVNGMFTTQAKAIKYANGSNNMAITNLTLG